MANYCTVNVQKAIFDLYRAQPWRTPAGALDFAFSSANGAGLQAQMIQQNGKNSKYSITYPTEVCTAVQATGTVACTDSPTTTAAITCDTFDGFDGYESNWHQLTATTMRDLGSLTAQQQLAHAVMNQMQKIKAEITADVLASINTAAGCIATGTTTRVLKLVNPVTGNPYPHTITGIENDFADAGYPVMPILLGNRQLNYLKNASDRGGVSDAGINNAGIASLPLFYDKLIDSTITPDTPGNENLFAIQPGIVNVLSWSENSGLFSSRNGDIDWLSKDPMSLVNTNNETYVHTVIQDPSSGLLFDFDLIWDARCKKFMWKVVSYFKTKILDLTGCKDSCFTGIIKYDVCPWAAGTCDS